MTHRLDAFTVRVGTAVLGALLTVATPRLSRAQVDPKVQEHFQAGNSLYEEGRYRDALAEYDAAYALAKNWKILFNRGQCLVMLKREPDAIASFEQYLLDGGTQVPPERRAQVEGDVKKLKARLGSIVVQGAPADALIEVDGVPIGKAPLAAPIVAGAGYHEISITPFGGKGATASVKVTAGEQVPFNVQVVSEPTAAAPAAPPAAPVVGAPPAPSPPSGLSAPGIQASAAVGVSSPSADYRYAEPPTLGTLEVAAAWRASPFWELGVFAGGAAGQYRFADSVRSRRTDPSIGIVDVDSNAGYSYGILGLRARMHLVRKKAVDGWLGVDLGRWSEAWSITGAQSFTYKAQSAALGLGLGADVPLGPRWALGLSARYLAATAADGARSACVGIDCNDPFLPGEGVSSGRSYSRGFLELGLRLVWSFPTDAEPAAAPIDPKPLDPKALARGSSLLNEPRIW